MKTFQILIFVAVVALALYQVFGAAGKQSSKSNVLVVKNKQAPKARVDIKNKSSFSSASNISRSSSMVDENLQSQRGVAGRAMKIFEISWSTYFEEWSELYSVSVNSNNEVKVSSDNVCEIEITRLQEEPQLVYFNEKSTVRLDPSAIVFMENTRVTSELPILENSERLLVASSELIKFCHENTRALRNVESR